MLSQKLIKMMGMGMLRDKAADPAPAAPPPAPANPAPANPDEIAQLKAKLAEYESKFKPENDLNEKARIEREANTKKAGEQKALEAAVRFDLSSKEFIKSHESILPKETADIFAAAEKETYDSPVQKASAMKAGIVSEFFKIQSNLDLLTPAHKSAVDGYLKLTKNGKEERAQDIYENIFEPAIEMLKRIKKAEEVNRAQSGLGNSTDSEAAYAKRMKELSEKHYLREKK